MELFSGSYQLLEKMLISFCNDFIFSDQVFSCLLITQQIVAGGFEENPAVFEEFYVAKKCRFKTLQRESALDGWVEEVSLLKHLEEVEDLVAYLPVLDDLMTE